MGSIGEVGDGQQGNSRMTDGIWECIEVNMDSGAIDNVMDKETGNQFELKETIMSKREPITRQQTGAQSRTGARRT